MAFIDGIQVNMTTYPERCINDITAIMESGNYNDNEFTMIFMTDGEPSAKTTIMNTVADFKSSLSNYNFLYGIRSRVYSVAFGLPGYINHDFLNALAQAGTETGSYYSTALNVTIAQETVASLVASLSGGINTTKS
jgi:hypothetical protein